MIEIGIAFPEALVIVVVDSGIADVICLIDRIAAARKLAEAETPPLQAAVDKAQVTMKAAWEALRQAEAHAGFNFAVMEDSGAVCGILSRSAKTRIAAGRSGKRWSDASADPIRRIT